MLTIYAGSILAPPAFMRKAHIAMQCGQNPSDPAAPGHLTYK